MQDKAAAADFHGRFREIVADPLNLLIERHPLAGQREGDAVILHNGLRVPLTGPGAYYGTFSEILVINRGVHEPGEEFAFQEMLAHLPPLPAMLELGAYWGHYSMWLGQARPGARLTLVEPDPQNIAAGRANLARNGIAGRFVEDFVGRGRFGVDAWMCRSGLDWLDVLHCDIQGFEVEMLEGADAALKDRRIGYCFISTHSQALHDRCADVMLARGYRIELAADFDHETTSFDGVIFAVHPDLPRVYAGPPPMGRSTLACSDGAARLAHLAAVDRGRVRGSG